MPLVWLRETLRIHNPTAKSFLAELLGTFLLVLIGDGAAARFILSGSPADSLSANIGFAIAVAIGIYVSGGVSGGHVNPAVSLGMCCLGRLRWTLLPIYWAAQLIGAFLGGAVVYAIYLDGINYFEGVNTRTLATASIFATYPQPYVTIQEALFDQIVGTALLVGGIVAFSDKRNIKPPFGLEPMMVGLLLLGIGISYGLNTGGAVNPARDFGPRVLSAFVGYGIDVWIGPSGEHIWWVPIIGPLVGGPLGAWVYYLAIELHHDEHDDPEELPLIARD